VKQDDTPTILRHWIEAVPHDRLAHLVKDAARTLVRALQVRLAEENIAFGHWTFLRIRWEHDGLTQKQLSDEAGVMEPNDVHGGDRAGATGLCEAQATPRQPQERACHADGTPVH
jgi:MarR family transcriptional regulator, organic hydroperoxide resistance regulator